MIFTRRFLVQNDSHSWSWYWTIEGTERVIEVFDAEGKPTVDRTIWGLADALKENELKRVTKARKR